MKRGKAVDHSAWTTILAKYVHSSEDAINRFAYEKVTAADRKALKTYLAALQKVKASALDDDERRAFWINLYNALTVDVVLDHRPRESIREVSISPGMLTVGPWDKPLVTVEGRALSLNNIEHDILRKEWGDPRVHYAVNCASTSCPNLAATAFTGAKLEQMLDDGARAYINHSRAVTAQDGKVTLSRIFKWYRDDFGKNDQDVLKHIAKYAKPALKKKIADAGDIDGYAYDWSLNEAKERK